MSQRMYDTLKNVGSGALFVSAMFALVVLLFVVFGS